MPLHHEFIKRAFRSPRRECFSDSLGVKLTCRKALAAARTLARALRRRLTASEKVGIWLPQSSGAALANISCYFAGKTPVNLNYTAGGEALESAVRRCGIEQVITAETFLEKYPFPAEAKALTLEKLRKEISFIDKLFAAAPVFLPAGIGVRWCKRASPARNKDLATVIFSSGSEGEPKGVLLSHANILANIRSFERVFTVRDDDCMLGVLPFFHAFGLTCTLWLPVVLDFRAAFHPNPLDSKGVGALAESSGATMMLATPTFIRHYKQIVEPARFSGLRMVICGAEKLRRETASDFKNKFGITVHEGYGCTEMSPIISTNLPPDPKTPLGKIMEKAGTVGRPIPGVEVKIVSPETGEEMPAGESGMILALGPSLMMGYLNDPERTAKAIRGDWYVTGDIGFIDEDGFLTITGRLSRFSKIAGEMVSHNRIEELLEGLFPDAGDHCFAVCGVPCKRRGERLVVLHRKVDLTPEQMRVKLGETGLPRLWIPAAVDFHEVEEIPVLGTGKLNLAAVRKKALELSGE